MVGIIRDDSKTEIAIMNQQEIDKMCMPYGHAFALLIFALTSLTILCLIFMSESGIYIPMVGTTFSLITWAILHLQFRHRLNKILKNPNS